MKGLAFDSARKMCDMSDFTSQLFHGNSVNMALDSVGS